MRRGTRVLEEAGNLVCRDVGLGDVGLGDVGLRDVGLGDVGLGDVGLGDVGLGDMRHGDGEFWYVRLGDAGTWDWGTFGDSRTWDVWTRGRDKQTAPEFCAGFIIFGDQEEGMICWRVRQQTSN